MRTWYFLFVLLLLITSCNDDHQKRVVDFSDTIPAEKPGARVPVPDALRVAVGAMVSPKETWHIPAGDGDPRWRKPWVRVVMGKGEIQTEV